MSNFKNLDRETPYLMPPSIQDWLPVNHLARFIVDVVSELDLRPFRDSYRLKGGTKPYDPSMLLSLLFYGYATGMNSSRKLEIASYENIPVRYICGNTHPDHDTIANFRKRFLDEIGNCFVQILTLAKELNFLNLGNVSIDGTKMKANASKHSAMSYAHASRLEEQLKAEILQLLKMAQKNDEDEQSQLDIPKELEIRNQRLEKIREPKKDIEDRAAQRDEIKDAVYQEKLAERERKEKQTGKKPRGKIPSPPRKGPQAKDQYNFTDSESAIMKTGSGFEQCYNAQAAVDQDSMLIVGQSLSACPNDKKQVTPVLDAIPEELGKVNNAAFDAGYFSESNISECDKRDIEAFIATGRQRHNSSLENLIRQKNLPELHEINTEGLSPKEGMKLKLNTKEGRAIYSLRKSTVEPVFGIIKQAMSIRQLLLRGVKDAQREWCLICSAYNLKRLHSLFLQRI
jgi:transposase